VDGAGSVAMRATVPGPALELTGCAAGQDAVAGFIQALKEIDGVTRVGVQVSSLESGSGGTGSGCEGQSLAQFQMVVAFDAAPVAPTGEGEAAPEGEAAVAAASSSSESGGEE
jgi:hypothetical protein